ncbi:MAG: sensor histidine kinase [Hyphomonadaceae bacterium]
MNPIVAKAQQDTKDQVYWRVGMACIVALIVAIATNWTIALTWLACISFGEGCVKWCGPKVAAGQIRYAPYYVIAIFSVVMTWVSLTYLLWYNGSELTRLVAVIALFTMATYSILNGHRSLSILVASVTPPLMMLLFLMVHYLWTNFPWTIASIASFALLGAIAIILVNARVLYRAGVDLRAAHLALSEERDSLELRVQARTEELTHALEATRAAYAVKTSFIGNISHEFRTPLNSIIGYAEIIKEDVDLGEKVSISDVNSIKRAGKHLLAMINDILNLTKFEAGRIDLQLDTVDLPLLLDQVRETVVHLVKSKPVDLKVDVVPDLPVLQTDSRCLLQCLINLAANACQFTDRGHVTLSVRPFSDPTQEWLWFSVIDTGCGIPSDQLERTFEPFTQVDSSLTRNHEGSGLGLAVTKRFSELLGARVEIRSRIGHGTQANLFVPVFPITKPQALAA